MEIVTVRMPSSLILSLQEQAESQHYKDVSELMRYLIREAAQHHSIKEGDQKELISQLREIITRLEHA